MHLHLHLDVPVFDWHLLAGALDVLEVEEVLKVQVEHVLILGDLGVLPSSQSGQMRYSMAKSSHC